MKVSRNPLRTLRWRIMSVPLLLCLFPLVAVVAGNAWDKTLDGRILKEVEEGAEDLAQHAAVDLERHVLTLAQQHDWRVVLIAERAGKPEVLFDFDQDAGSPFMQGVSDLILGDGEVPRREPLVFGAPYPKPECKVFTPPGILTCRAYAQSEGGTFVVEQSSRRAVRALYDARYPLFKLALFVVPFALFFGLWLDHRLLKPTLKLRKEIESALVQNTSPAFQSSRSDEVGALTRSLAELSERLAAQRKDTESLLGDLAHELKNPWSAVVSAVDTLQNRPLSDEDLRLLAIIERSASTQLRTLEEFLVYARARAELASPEVETFSLAELLHNLASLTQSFKIEIDCDPTLEVRWPVHSVSRIVRNLFDNAAAFAQTRISVSAVVSDEKIEICVEDDGAGVPEDFEEQLFVRFQSRKDGGTGLGLALSRALAENLGGTLTYQRQSTTQFRLTLPEAMS